MDQPRASPHPRSMPAPPNPVPHRIDVQVDPAYDPRLAPGGSLHGIPALLAGAIRHTLESRNPTAAPGGPEDEGLPRAVSLRLTDTRTVHRLNKRYLGHDEPTDTLSFNTDIPGLRDPHGVEELGTLIIALPVAARGARSRRVALADELCLLAVHGALHLLGFDHQTPSEDAVMRRMERVALTRLGRRQAARPQED